jgi:hypothetical protein
VATHKANARQAAAALCWEVESQVLADVLKPSLVATM